MNAEKSESGRLAENIAYFARALRKAGVPVGPAQISDAVAAVELTGLGSKSDFYWALHAFFIRRREHHVLFDQAFRLFWQKRNLLEKMMAMMMPADSRPGRSDKPKSANRRVSEAMFDGVSDQRPVSRPTIEVDAHLTASGREVLRTKDFDEMTAAEIAAAKLEIGRLRQVFQPLCTRRFKQSNQPVRIDPRRTLRASLRGGGASIALVHRAPAERIPPIAVLCDISGSMSNYSRLFLHFMHALTTDGHRLHAFTFGTRLTNITRQLQHRDPDEALERCSSAVADWSGGTRISGSLHAFNRLWSRRVLSQSATVVLMTDGLEREDDGMLEHEMDRLHRSCRRLIWLNPLLGYDGFKAKARGIRTILPHVDAFRPIHNLASMEDLVTALASPRGVSQFRAADWLDAA